MTICSSCGRDFVEDSCPICKSPQPTKRARSLSTTATREIRLVSVLQNAATTLKNIEKLLSKQTTLLEKQTSLLASRNLHTQTPDPIAMTDGRTEPKTTLLASRNLHTQTLDPPVTTDGRTEPQSVTEASNDARETTRAKQRKRIAPFNIGAAVIFRGKQFTVESAPADSRHGYVLTSTTDTTYKVTARARDLALQKEPVSDPPITCPQETQAELAVGDVVRVNSTKQQFTIHTINPLCGISPDGRTFFPRNAVEKI